MKFIASAPLRGRTSHIRLAKLLRGVLCLIVLVGSIDLFGAAPAFAESIYYLGTLGWTSSGGPSITLPNVSPYGQVNLACRTGWRFIEPQYNSFVWDSIDDCQTVAYNAGAKWSLSIKIGADTPLWLFSSASCHATPVSGEDGSGGAHAVLTAFQFTWTSGYGNEYPNPSTQCIPIPWNTTYQSQLNSFIQAVASHIKASGKPLPDHVVVTGINFNTQENSQPYCNTAGCGYGGGSNTDISNWEALVHGIDPTCNGTPPPAICQTDFNSWINTAYNTIIGYWGGSAAFPSPTRLASMFIDYGTFPFNSNTTLGLNLLNDVVNYDSTRSIVMNNAAKYSGGPDLVSWIICYQINGTGCQSGQLTSNIAFQEYDAVTGSGGTCSNLTTLLNAAAHDNSLFMETYLLDITDCSL